MKNLFFYWTRHEWQRHLWHMERVAEQKAQCDGLNAFIFFARSI